MPPRPPTPDTLKMEVNWQHLGETNWTNIFYVLASGNPASPTIITEMAAAFYTVCHTRLAPNTIDTLTSVLCIDNTGASDTAVVYTESTEGGLGGTPYPVSVAACLSWQIASRYRGGKPRTYISGLTSAVSTTPGSNVLSTSTQTAMSTAGTDMLADVAALSTGSLGWTLGTISYRTGGAERPEPPFVAYTGCIVHPRLDSQRRRLGKETGTI